MEKDPLDVVTAVIFFTNIATSVRSKVWDRHCQTESSEYIENQWDTVYRNGNRFVEKALDQRNSILVIIIRTIIRHHFWR